MQHSVTYPISFTLGAYTPKSVRRYLAYCNTLQYTATYCNILQHTATHCNTLSLSLPLSLALCFSLSPTHKLIVTVQS